MFSAQRWQISAFRSPACWLYPLKPDGKQGVGDMRDVNLPGRVNKPLELTTTKKGVWTSTSGWWPTSLDSKPSTPESPTTSTSTNLETPNRCQSFKKPHLSFLLLCLLPPLFSPISSVILFSVLISSLFFSLLTSLLHSYFISSSPTHLSLPFSNANITQKAKTWAIYFS